MTVLESFVSNYVAIVRALMAFRKWKDAEASSKASILLNSITSSSLLVALFTAVSLCLNTDQLSKQLLQKTENLKNSMEKVNTIIECLNEIRENSDAQYYRVMKWLRDTIAPLHITLQTTKKMRSTST